MAKMTKKRAKAIKEQNAPTNQKLPDGTRKYKMFNETDEESADAVALARYLLRFMDNNMLDALKYEEKDDEGNVTGSEVCIYTRDDERGDIIFTISSMYITSDERQKETEGMVEEDADNWKEYKDVMLNDEETANKSEIREKSCSPSEGETSEK